MRQHSRLTLIHRHGCELCDEMQADLEALKSRLELPPVAIVDVDGDPDLVRRFGLDVPVLLLDDRVVCRHRLDAAELARLLRSSYPPSPP